MSDSKKVVSPDIKSTQNYDPLQYYTVQEELLRKQAYQEF
jgi:hypothetical protein